MILVSFRFRFGSFFGFRPALFRASSFMPKFFLDKFCNLFFAFILAAFIFYKKNSTMSFHRNDKLDFRQPHNQFDGIKKTNCDNNSQKRRDHNSNHKQRQPNDGKNDDEEERTRRRIEQRRQSGKGTTGNLTSTNNQRTKNSEEEKEVAKSERILNSLIEEVRHRKEGALTSARLNVQKENAEESEGDGSRTTKQKKHKKKKRQKEKEHKSKKKSHQSSKSRDYSEDETERHTKKKKKHHQSEGGEEEEEWTKSVRGLRVEVDETKGSRVVTASDGDEMSFCADFQLFGYEKAKDDSRAAISKSMARKQQNFDNSGSDSDEDGAGNSDDQSDESLSQKKQPTLANILASAPVTFPWLTALGNTKQSEDADGEKAEQSEKKVEQKREEQKKETDQKTDHNINKKESKEGTTAKSLKKKSRHRRRSSERSSSKQRKHVKRKASRSRSRTYSTSPERIISHEKGRHRHNRPSTSKSPTPLPPFSKQRAFETRRKLIEESWHRRIEQSVRPCEVIAKKSVTDSNGPGESEYTDKNGRIDKQKLLEIATRNATRLAMEGKLPKGAELVETIKNKSVGQLVDLCSKLQSDPSLKLKRHGDASSNSESDEEKRYSHEYDKWQQKEQRREDREFRNRAVRPAGESAPLSRREQKEIVQREENTLRLTFPVSSGVQHRVKANAPAPAETPAGPLVRFGDIGPLTTALAKVRTNIPAAYKPLSKPLPLALPTSTLSTNFQSTSQVQLGPQLPSPDCQPNKPFCSDFVPAKKLDCVNQNVYEIALAASARKEEAESRDKTSQTVPLTATSAQFIGPMVPNPAIDSVQTASRLLNTDSESTDPKPSSTIKETLSSKSVFSSSWDRPGHIAAREAFLKKIAEQKRKAEQEKSDGKGTDGSETQKMEQKQTAKEMPMGDGAQLQKNPNASLPTIVVPQLDMAPSSSSSPHVCATTTTTTFSHSESVSMSVPSPHQKQVSTNGTTGTSSTTTAPTNENRTNDVEQFKKPALPPVSKQTFVASHAGTSMLLPADTKQQVEVPQRRTNDEKSSESTKAMEGQGNNFLDRFHFFVEAQVARQKAESALQATILSTAVQQKPIAAFREEVPTFSSSSSSFSSRPVFAMAPLPFSRSETQGLTKPQKSIQELVAERLRYTHRLQRDPNDYEARKALARVDKEMSLWAQDSSLPGEFTGNTGARVLSEKELEPSDPRFHAWAKKDQFRTAPEINSGIGMKLLQRMGWQPGQGLGRDRAGQLEPLTLDVKADRKGLFSSFERAPTRESVLDSAGKNPVSVLMEQCARHHWHNPEFSCVESGPQNNRRYLWKAVLNGVEYTPSLPSSNKKAAKAQVCMVILEALGLTTN